MHLFATIAALLGLSFAHIITIQCIFEPFDLIDLHKVQRTWEEVGYFIYLITVKIF